MHHGHTCMLLHGPVMLVKSAEEYVHNHTFWHKISLSMSPTRIVPGPFFIRQRKLLKSLWRVCNVSEVMVTSMVRLIYYPSLCKVNNISPLMQTTPWDVSSVTRGCMLLEPALKRLEGCLLDGSSTWTLRIGFKDGYWLWHDYNIKANKKLPA